MINNIDNIYLNITSLIFILFLTIIFIYKKKIKSIENNLFILIILENLIGLILCLILSIKNTYYYLKYISIFKFIWVIFIFLLLYNNSKKEEITLNNKRLIPFYEYLIFNIIISILQFIYIDLNFIYVLNSFISIIVYFTMENPDVKLYELERTEKDRALKLSEAKTIFLESMSKELRTPLSSIIGISEDLNTYEVNNDEINEDITDITNASNTLLDIIGNIVDISKIESGKLEILPSDYDPKEEFNNLAKIMRTKVEEKPIEFNVKISDNIPNVLYGDRIRIKQIINNFLSNAIKYTEKGSIDFIVEWYDASRSLYIKVSDTGIGIKNEDIDKLFTKYDRLNVEKVSSVQGTGLGLNITKNLIEAMNGKISVESEYGKGTTFITIIPSQLGNEEKYNSIKQENNKNINYDFNNRSILLVDDNQLNIKSLKKTLKTFNLNIDECYSAKDALEKVKLNKYDVIISDIGMPEMNGEELLHTLKSLHEFNTPVIALTAEASFNSKNKYLEMGFYDYMLKPATKKEISKKLYELFNKDNTN